MTNKTRTYLSISNTKCIRLDGKTPNCGNIRGMRWGLTSVEAENFLANVTIALKSEPAISKLLGKWKWQH